MEGKLMLQHIVLLTCFCWNSMARASSLDEFRSLITNVVDDQDKAIANPNSRISGPNGYCIEVKNGDYHNGNSIIVSPCEDDKVSQMWTFESDGTLRSNGKCLTTYGFRPGAYIMIYGCYDAAKHAKIWELKSNGEIVNPKSGLVVTAMSPLDPTLTVETSTHSWLQTWRADNNTQPILVAIVGLDGLCLQAKDSAVWVEGCETSREGQQWFLYPDRTIRPMWNAIGCLGFVSPVNNNKVVVQSCGIEPSNERWLFTENGTIWNEQADLVMDVANSDPNHKKIIVWKANGGQNQKWKVSPLTL